MTDILLEGGDFNFPQLIEFHPFSKKELEQYLRESVRKWKLLAARQKQVRESLKTFLEKQEIDGLSLEEWIETYAYRSMMYDQIGSSGNHYDPDTLHKQWEKIFKNYDIQNRNYVRTLIHIQYEQKQIQLVNQCIDRLPVQERDVVISVLINNETVRGYCQNNQMGHTKYCEIKERALRRLLDICNKKLAELYESEKANEKTAMANINLMHWSGNS